MPPKAAPKPIGKAAPKAPARRKGGDEKRRRFTRPPQEPDGKADAGEA